MLKISEIKDFLLLFWGNSGTNEFVNQMTG